MKRRLFAAHSTIRNTLFVLVAIAITFFVVLKNGISIDHLKIASLTVERLYLKLDKKLILRADKLTIPASKKKQPLPNLEEGLDRFNEILRYFETIELKEIEFKNDHYSILYSDNIFYMVNDLFEIATHQISRVGDEVQAIIDLIYIKKYDIRLSGKLVYNYKKDTALVRGSAEYRDIHADFMLNKKKKILYFTMKSGQFAQLKPLIDQFPISPKIAPWITDRVKAEHYRLESLKGAARIDKKGIRLIPDSLTGAALLQNASVDFKDGLKIVKAEEMKVLFRKGNLYFEPTRPYYDAVGLAGSRVSIVDLLNPKSVILKLDLKFDTTLGPELLKIVNAYGIDIPLLQKSGTTDSRVRIDVDLKAKKVTCMCDFRPKKGEIEIGGLKLPVSNGWVHIEDGTVTLSNIGLRSKLYQLSADGKIDLGAKSANLNLDVKSFRLEKEGETFFSIQNRKLPVKIRYRESVIVSLPSLGTEIKVSKKNGSGTIKIADIRLLKESLKNLPITVNGGHLTITTKDFKHFAFEGLLKRRDCFIYENDSSCLSQIPIYGTASDKGFILRGFQNRFVFNAEKSTIILKNLNLDLKKYFDDLESGSGGKMKRKIKISAKNSTLRYGKSKLVTDRYLLGILPGGNFHFRGSLGQDTVTVTKKGEKLEIKADRISDRMLHPLINFGGLQKGRYSLRMSGVPGKMMQGEIKLENGIMSNFKAYNNVLALINTLPALATLNSPGFSAKGFVIRSGVIKFTVFEGRLLTFDSVLIKGKSATISGDGVVNIETGKIDIDLAIQTAKGVGNLIGKLPVVGYILTGKNKSLMTVGLHIGGTLDKPTTKTSPIKDVLMLPFKMLERTFTAPGKKKEDLNEVF